MSENWVSKEFHLTNLGDQRLNKRLSMLTERFSKSPESPINQACENWAETKAAYRFFQNDSISYREITKSHIEATKQRCSEFSTILAIQDTTYFNYSDHPETKGLCPLSRNKGKHKKDIVTLGLIMHSTLAVSTDGLPLGVIDQKIYSRPELSKEKKELKKNTHNNALSIEDKDSFRWLESLKNCNNTFITKSTKIITVCDREADIYDFFLLADHLKSSVLVRANHNRKINKKSPFSEITGEELWNLVKRIKCKGTIKIKIPKQKDRAARTATCHIKFSEINMTPPRNHLGIKTKKLPTLKLYAIYVSEINCPKDAEPIDWILLTNIPIQNIYQALEKIEWYCLRWRIETWHKIIKSGLKVEDCRLSTSERLIRYLAVMSIVAWRIFWITLLSRVTPNVPCYLFLNDLEWKILFSKLNHGKNIPGHPPTVKQSVIWIARLGGFLARKGDKEPGITYVWRGLKKFSAILEGVELAKKIYG